MKQLKVLVLFFALAQMGIASENSDPTEELLGVTVNESGIVFQVNSSGCTYKRDFRFFVEEKLESLSPMLPAYEHHYYITAKRVRSDACDAFVPYGTQIFVSFDELGIAFGKYHVQNPIGGEMTVTSP